MTMTMTMTMTMEYFIRTPPPKKNSKISNIVDNSIIIMLWKCEYEIILVIDILVCPGELLSAL